MPAEILSFWDWAATKGIEFSSPWTRAEYEEYVKAATVVPKPEPPPEPVKPEPTEPTYPPGPVIPKPVEPPRPRVTIANRRQQVYTPGLAPKATYSRVVSLQFEVSEAVPMVYEYTPVLGNNIWVLGIKAWVMSKIPNLTKRTTLWFRCGVGVPTSAAVMADWVNLLPKHHAGAGDPGWFFFDGETEKSWTIAKRFQGESRRLGVFGTRDPGLPDEVQVSFLISEG